MGEEHAVESVDDPVTVPSLATDLRELGLEAGDTVLVHSSLSALGWVCGGPPAVVDALQEVVTDAGTIAMPTHSGSYSDPADWSNPPVPDEWEETIRETMPPYRPAVTPTQVGAIPECFRTYPETRRSAHPTVSFAAWGAEAESVVADHGLDDRLGDGSPLARLYDLNADVLFLGVGHDTNTSLHLAENRAEIPIERVTDGAPILEDGRRRWVEMENIAEDTDDFADLGAAFEREVGLVEGRVGVGTGKLMDQRALVDFAVEWLEANR
ncbi:AAC(3) family N-acetyltransferase [Halomontanus rarus]|uniref:AAC(3) family N-acetyltransferase n=1 Tax=Halomontanus rarus TaxID=3034020 RepID=UPI001A993431